MIPRLSIEAIGISAMLGIIAFLMFRGREVNTMFPQISAFAMAAVRLMPSMNRMSTALNTMAYQEPRLDQLLAYQHITKQNGASKKDEEIISEEIVIRENPHSRKEPSFKKSIKLNDIEYIYPNTVTPILFNANMEILFGKSVGVVGLSGSGKTTAIDILLGLLLPQKGEVLVDDIDIQTNYMDWLSHIGYIPQMIFMLDDTIRANVAFGIDRENIDDFKVWNALNEARLADFVRSLPLGLDTSIGERGIRLSGGQRQRIGIARALYTDPELLIFDEATSALDSETEMAIMESINNLHGKKTMIIIAHRLGTIKECDTVYRVEDGKIYKER